MCFSIILKKNYKKNNLMLSDCYLKFQPQYYNGEIFSYEALLRTTASNIEDYIDHIDDHAVFDLAVIKFVINQRSLLSHGEKIQLSINISISSLLDDTFIKACMSIFEHEKKIILELTRHDQTNDFDRIQQVIKDLKVQGVLFSLDDYGKGYVNSEMFLHLDIDYIKLDKKLIKQVDQSYIAYSLIKTTYDKIAKVLGKHVIVEGIETFEQLNLLKQFGDMTYQGFYFSEPLDIDKVKPTKSFSYKHKIDSKSFCNQLDQAIYNINRAQNPQAIKTAITRLIQLDKYNIIGVSPNIFDVYSEQRRINENYNELLEKRSSPHLLLVSSLISTCDALVIIRDSEGQTIYNNKKHIKYLGADLVKYTAEQACERFPDYSTCIELDKGLLSGDTCFMVSNESVETEHGKQRFKTYRQKITHFNKAFIICSVYEANDSINIDDLTGCYQRSYLESKHALNYQTLIFIDLDGFKVINDFYGHSKGDEVLRDFAKTMKYMLRDSDTVVRFGGDEFVLLLEGTSRLAVQQRIEIIRANIEAYFAVKQLQLSFSYGVVEIEGDINSALNKADKAMYEQKYARKG